MNNPMEGIELSRFWYYGTYKEHGDKTYRLEGIST